MNNDYDYYDDMDLYDDDDASIATALTPAPTIEVPDWRAVKIHFGKKAGTSLGSMTPCDLKWWAANWSPNPNYKITLADRLLEAALRLAVAAITPEEIQAAEVTRVGNYTGTHLGEVGAKIKVAVTVGIVKEWTTEFNRKKVVQNSAYFMTEAGAVLYWKSSAMPVEIKEGERLTITGSVKEHFVDQDGRRVTAIIRVKVDGAIKLAPTHRLVLVCDAKSSHDAFAVCADDGSVLNYGVCGLGRTSDGDNSDHELAAALAAFKIANRVKVAANLDCLRLELRFDAQWLTRMVGKAKPLRDFARANNIVVEMIWIPGESNPADEWTMARGSKALEIVEAVAHLEAV